MSLPVPYTSRFGSPLVAGQTIEIHGLANADAKRLEANLLAGGSEIGAGQAALHASIRFDEGKLVLNSYLEGAWGKEERTSLGIKPSDKFELRIRVLEDKLIVSINGKEMSSYAHRLPFHNIEFLQIKGDCSLQSVNWGGKVFTLPWESGFANGSLRAGERINAYLKMKGDRFNLDFIGRNGDILFHFNPRIDQSNVVRNSFVNGVWQNEEREGPFPFHKNVGFHLSIINEPFSIQIVVDGQQIGTFAHRTANPAEDYIGVRIAGEAEMETLEFV